MERFREILNFLAFKYKVDPCVDFNLFSAGQLRIISVHLVNFVWKIFFLNLYHQSTKLKNVHLVVDEVLKVGNHCFDITFCLNNQNEEIFLVPLKLLKTEKVFTVKNDSSKRIASYEKFKQSSRKKMKQICTFEPCLSHDDSLLGSKALKSTKKLPLLNSESTRFVERFFS